MNAHFFTVFCFNAYQQQKLINFDMLHMKNEAF